MADDKTPARPAAGGGTAGAAETVQSQKATDTKSTDQGGATTAAAKPQAGRHKAQLSGADRDRGLRTGSRTGGTTEAMAEELDRIGVDARLDNRVGDQRPVLASYLKPQQFPGPEVGHFGEHADELGDAFSEATAAPDGDVLGSRSLGQLGRGEDTEDADEAAPSEPQPK